MTKQPDLCTNEHLEYLDNLRDSGATNMFSTTPYLQREFAIKQHEWHGRYLQRLVDQGNLACREAYDTLIAGMGGHDHMENSPEDAADEELNLWASDG